MPHMMENPTAVLMLLGALIVLVLAVLVAVRIYGERQTRAAAQTTAPPAAPFEVPADQREESPWTRLRLARHTTH